jgi:hypothetical protein
LQEYRMSVVEEAESGFTIRVSGRLLLIRHWGVMTCALGQAFVEQYKAAVTPLLLTNWAEVVDLVDVLAVEPGRRAEVASLFEFENLQNNVATAYIISERTAPDHLRDLRHLIASQTASFADQFFRDPLEALNWVNQRLAMAH